jgi:ATP-dependent RNA helicase DDX35
MRDGRCVVYASGPANASARFAGVSAARADAARGSWAQGEGDLVTYLNVFRAYKSNGENPQWCNRNYLKHKVLARVKDIRKQLCFHLQRMRVPVVAADRDDRTAVAVRKAVTAGFFANAVQSVAAGGYSSLRAGGCTRLDVHPSSVLFNSRPPHLVFHHVQKTDKVWMLEVCTVEPDWLTELAPHFYERRR